MTLGAIIYMFGDDQAGGMSVANNPPVQMTERGMRNRAIEPNTVPGTIGQTDAAVTLHSSQSAKTPAPLVRGFLHATLSPRGDD